MIVVAVAPYGLVLISLELFTVLYCVFCLLICVLTLYTSDTIGINRDICLCLGLVGASFVFVYLPADFVA